MPQADGKDLSLVFLIDALGNELIGSGGFLDSLCPPERSKVRSVLGFSSAAISTIVTGRTPAEHGHWSMYRRRDKSSPFDPYRGKLRLASYLPRGQWRVRRWLADRLRKDGLTGYFALYDVPLQHLSLFDLCQSKSIYHTGAFDSVKSLFDRLVEEDVPYRVWDWSTPTTRAFIEMEEAVRDESQRLLFLYTPDLDSAIHLHGPRSSAVTGWLKVAEQKIEGIVSAAKSAGRKPRLRVFGDHGMALVHSHLNIAADLRRIDARMPRDYVVFLDSTMARFWFHADSARREILDLLSGCRDGRFLSEDDLSTLGVDFPNREYGEEIFLVNPGVLILPSFMSSLPILGMHGYHPDDPDSDTVLIADPAPASPPNEIHGIAEMLLNDLGLSMERP